MPPVIILPDQLHRSANDVLIGELYRYVRGGGNLMVVYDACTFDLNGRFPPGDSRLSELVGVRYALYDLYTGSTMEPARVTGTSEAMQEIDIPPGSFVPLHANREQRVHSPVGAERDDTSRQFAFAAYEYGNIDYPVFRTLGEFDGTVLLRSKHALAAGYRQEGLGRVLFVNLPLGYLASRTDGLLLHSFLHFFGIRMLGLPYLLSVPDGVGGSDLQLAHRRALVVAATQNPGGRRAFSTAASSPSTSLLAPTSMRLATIRALMSLTIPKFKSGSTIGSPTETKLAAMEAGSTTTSAFTSAIPMKAGSRNTWR